MYKRLVVEAERELGYDGSMIWREHLTVALFAIAASVLPAGEDADFNKARYLHSVQEYKLAVEAAQKYLRTYSKSERSGSAQLLLADSHYQLKDYAKAGPAFASYVASQPKSAHRPQALQRAVKAFYLAKNYDRSVTLANTFLGDYRAALKKPEHPLALPALFEDVLYYAGESSYAKKDFAQARSYWTELQTAFPNSKLVPDVSEGLGWIAFEAQKYDAALLLFQRTAATPKHSKAASSQLMVARCLDELDRPAEAVAALDHLAQLSPGKVETREAALWRPVFLLHAKRYAEAVTAFKALAKTCPDHPNAAVVTLDGVKQLQDDSKNEEAIALADLYLLTFKTASDRAGIACMKSRALSALKRRDEARKAAEMAVAEAEQLPKGEKRDNVELPAALMRLAELSGAGGMPYYERVVKDHPNTPFAPPAHYQLAYWAGETGHLDDALQHATKLLERLPKDKPELAALRAKTLFAAAEFAYRKENYKAAEPRLTEYLALAVVQKDPAAKRAALAYLRLGWCCFKRKDLAAAAKAATAGLQAKPDPKRRIQLLYLQGLSQIPGESGADAPGLDSFEQMVRDFPEHERTAQAAYHAAQFLAKEARAKALVWLDRIVENPTFKELPLRKEALELRAHLRYENGNYADALTDVDVLLKRPNPGPRAPALRLLRAASLESLPGKAAEAETAYGELIAAGPATAPQVRQAYRRRAQLRFKAKQFMKAEEDLTVYLNGKQPKAGENTEIEAALLRAICRKERDDKAGAKSELDQLAALPLTGATAFEVPFQLGNLAYVKGDNEAAAGWYQRALKAAEANKDLPKDPVAAAMLNLAWSYRRDGKLKEADTAFGKLLAFAPDSPHANEARMQRGRLMANDGNLESAIALWTELLTKSPQGEMAEDARYELAAALARGGRYADGAKAFEEFLTRHADSKLNRDALCGLGECRVQLRKNDTAKEAFMEVLGPDGPDAELDECGQRAVLGLSEMALAAGDANQAKKLALRILPGSKWFDAALYLCGRASENLAEPEKAIAYYRKLVSDCPKSSRIETAKERLKALGSL